MTVPPKKNTAEIPDIPGIVLERIGFLLTRLGQGVREVVEEALKSLGITGKHLGILLIIKEKGSLPQQEIGKCIHVDRTTMVQIIDDLEKLGYVERRDNPEDRRAYFLSVTAKGRDILPKAMQMAIGAEKEFMATLSLKEQKELILVLKKLFTGHFYPDPLKSQASSRA